MDNILLTPSALIDLLSQIDELNDYNISVTEAIDGKIQIQVGESTYSVDTHNAAEVSVDPSAIDQVTEENMNAYESMENSGNIELSEPIESGIITNAVKSLLLGGLIRLVPKLLR